MSKDNTPPSARAVRPGRQLIVHLLFAALLIGGMSAYWFGVKGHSENQQAQTAQRNVLDAAGSRIESRLQSIELISSLIGNSILVKGSVGLLNDANALPRTAVDGSGLIAISWWPQYSNSQPRYLVRETGTWLEHDIGGNDLSALAQRKLWFLLAPELASNGCLWSEREREAISGQMVVSCSRAIRDSQQRFLGVLRYSYRTTAFDNLLASLSTEPVMLTSSAGAYLASNTPRINEVRSLADVGQRLPALSPLTTALYGATNESLRKVQASPDFPKELAARLVDAGIENDLNRAATAVAAVIASQKSLELGAICAEGWCAQSRTIFGAPWMLVSMGELPSVASIAAAQLPQNLPLLIFSAGVLILALLNYLVLVLGWMRPLSKLVAPLSRMDPGPGFDEKLSGEWGQLAHALNELAENNGRLRAQLIDPRQAAARAAQPPQMSLDVLPVAAVLLGPDGHIQEANKQACSLLDLCPGTDAKEIYLQREPDGELFSLAAVPDAWLSQLCSFRTANVEGCYGVSSTILESPPGRLLLFARMPSANTQKAALTSSAPREVVTTHKAPHGMGIARQALARLSAPVRWLSLEAGPEMVSPALTDSAAQAHFRQQLEARIEDRLEANEELLQWGPGHFVIAAINGIQEERADELRQGIQSTLIFLANERVRLKANTALFTVRPQMSSQDFDAAIYAAMREAQGKPVTEETRTYDAATLTRLVNKGFQEKRFQLITEHGLHPGVKDDDSLAFRVLPHLEDDEGFWMGSREFMPTLMRMGRRGEHDTWLLDAVHAALRTLNDKAPEQVLLPLCGQILASSHNEVAEKLTALARDPAIDRSTIYVSLNADEALSSGVDLLRLRNLIHSLGCRMALANISMDTQSMGLLERIRPDMLIVRETLVQAALDSPIIGIGLESLIRAGDKLKCSTVLPGINNDHGRQLVEKLRPSLAFGFAIGKPSPLPFRAVA